MTETTTEQLAEIEGQATGYTPPEGWRVLAVGEVLRNGDMWVWPTDDQLRQTVHVGAVVGANQRYIRRIEPQPQTEPDKTQELPTKTQELPDKTQELPAQYTPPEGWRLVRFGELLLPGDQWVNWDGTVSRPDILHGDGATASGGRYIRLIKPKPQPEPQPQPEPAAIEELRSEVSYVQRLLGESRQRVTTLEELVTSLRTINEAQERAFNAANKANDDLEHRLNVVAAELVTQFETSRRLQIELDAAQQVPQAIADRFEEGWNQGTARAVEAVLAWLEPVRLVDNPNLANEAMQHLPQIMRHLTGLALED